MATTSGRDMKASIFTSRLRVRRCTATGSGPAPARLQIACADTQNKPTESIEFSFWLSAHIVLQQAQKQLCA